MQANAEPNPKGHEQVYQPDDDRRCDARVQPPSPEHAHEGVDGDDLDPNRYYIRHQTTGTHQGCASHTGLAELLQRSCIDDQQTTSSWGLLRSRTLRRAVFATECLSQIYPADGGNFTQGLNDVEGEQ